MPDPTLTTVLAAAVGLTSLFVAAYSTNSSSSSYAYSWTEATRVAEPIRRSYNSVRRSLNGRQGHMASSEAGAGSVSTTDDLFILSSSSPFLHFNISSTATIDLADFLPRGMVDGHMPVLLDSLSGCSWLPTTEMICVNFNQSDPVPSNGPFVNTTTTGTGFVPNQNCLQDAGFTGGPVTAVRAQQGDNTTLDRRQCTHYLAGSVTGSSYHAALDFRSALMVPFSVTNAAATAAENDISGFSAKFLLVDEFEAPGQLGFSEFQRYYGGGSGVLGLAMGTDEQNPEEQSAQWDDLFVKGDAFVSEWGGGSGTSILAGEAVAVVGRIDDSDGIYADEQEETSRSTLEAIFSSKAFQSGRMRKIIGLALPRNLSETGTLTLGAPVREAFQLHDLNMTLETEGQLAMSGFLASNPSLNGSATQDPDAEGRHLPWSFSDVSIVVNTDGSGPLGPVLMPRHDPTSAESQLGAERYYIDTALPVIWTSQVTTAFVASMFSPPGWFELDAPSSSSNSSGASGPVRRHPEHDEEEVVGMGTFRVHCNATAPSSLSVALSDGTSHVAVPLYPKDLVVGIRLGQDQRERTCMSAFQNGDLVVPVADSDGGNATSAEHHFELLRLRRLGWPFLRNVLLDLDFDARKIGVGVRSWPTTEVSSGAENASNTSSIPNTSFSMLSLSGPTTFKTSTIPNLSPSGVASTTTSTLPPKTTILTETALSVTTTVTMVASESSTPSLGMNITFQPTEMTHSHLPTTPVASQNPDIGITFDPTPFTHSNTETWSYSTRSDQFGNPRESWDTGLPSVVSFETCTGMSTEVTDPVRTGKGVI